MVNQIDKSTEKVHKNELKSQEKKTQTNSSSVPSKVTKKNQVSWFKFSGLSLTQKYLVPCFLLSLLLL
jgi:hypothetical protein